MKSDRCTVMRRMLVRSSSLNMATGESRETGSEWVTRACGVPLFGAAEREAGACRSCAKGWTHAENFPVPVCSKGTVGCNAKPEGPHENCWIDPAAWQPEAAQEAP